MADTPGSAAESSTPAKTPAAKDKNCPFCGAAFTSSSLGRHLDLYIKEKNPKPPDGIHHVDDIRKMRGNVTRRQARTSSAKRHDSTPSSVKQTPMHEPRSPIGSRPYVNGDPSNANNVQLSFNQPSWEATGVMNDLPMPSSNGTPRLNTRRDDHQRASQKNDLLRRQKALEERDRGRAAELALKEVLDSVRAANVHAHPPSPLDFDLFSQTFPALCLRCLPKPATISTSQHIIGSSSWNVPPPGQVQLDSLQQWLDAKLRTWRDQRVSNLQTQPPVNGNHDEGSERDSAYRDYLNNSFQAWNELSARQKQESWHVESLNAFAREKDDHKETQAMLERVDQENQNLRAQIEHLSRNQQPREFLSHPPMTLPLSRDIAKLACRPNANNTLDPTVWDYERLVSKHLNNIRSDRGAQKALPSATSTGNHIRSNGISSSRDLNKHIQQNGNSGVDDSNVDDGLADAPGEEDEDLHLQGRGSVMDRGMLDPKLRDGGASDGVMEGIEGVDGEGDTDGDGGTEGFVGGRVLIGLRDYTGAVNGGGCNLP